MSWTKEKTGMGDTVGGNGQGILRARDSADGRMFCRLSQFTWLDLFSVRALGRTRYLGLVKTDGLAERML